MHFQERPISLLVYLHDSVIVSCAIKVPQTTWHTVVSKKPANPEKYFPYVHSPAALPGAPASVLLSDTKLWADTPLWENKLKHLNIESN